MYIFPLGHQYIYKANLAREILPLLNIVLILGPLGDGPSTLPLRQSAADEQLRIYNLF